MFLNGCSETATLYSQQGKKGTNQDAMIVWENFCSREDTIFCGIFDGHGPYGHLVARRVRDSLPLKLNANWEANTKTDDIGLKDESSLNDKGGLSSENTPFLSLDEKKTRVSNDDKGMEQQPELFNQLHEAFFNAFKAMDRELKIHANVDCYCSGTTAVALIKRGQDIVFGNVGDSRAVLATRNEDNSLTPVQLTVDLKPSLPEEAERIRKCKGRVFALYDEPEVPRVWLPNNDSPGLAMARAFGDFCLKDCGLISVPRVSYRHLSPRDEFIVLATDGIWDVLSNQEVVDTVDACPTRSATAQTLVETAVKAWKSKYPTSKVDDCAVVCLFLNSTGGPDVSTQAYSTDARKEQVPEGDDLEENDQPWLALEGASHVNTLMDLPMFTPEK